ncbi:putative Cullin-3-B [Glarea lozoyensis 74030]|uniref:Putative Cullin-3-B n=1 Tax=Glarea lozoyensis (strain ATCC 74030 / MF5533) TaxID=1104152 RepID=H0EFD0_GLAL7|nr:putative Cullin-3-B [Glarea lozoyensis 74030]
MISGRGRGKIRAPRRGVLGAHGDGDEFGAMWEILRSALREIHEKNASKLSFEQLYRASYKIVLKKQGDRLYEHVKEFEEQWFASQVMPVIRKLITNNLINITQGGIASATANERRLTGEEFLKGLKLSWQDHVTVMNMTTDVLMCMDRIYCHDNRKASIFTTTMGLFRDHILRAPLAATSENMITADILNSVVLDQIGMERDGDVINKYHIRSCMSMLERLYETDEEAENDKLYLTMFEPEFLANSRTFYKKECSALLRDSDASTWLRQTKKRLAEEAARCQTTISPLTAPKIAKVVEEEMISAHLSEFLQMEGSGIKAMINNDRFEDLEALYQQISRVDPAKVPLKKALQSQVVSLGMEINKSITETDFTTVQAAPENGETVEAVEGGASKPKPPSKKSTINAQTLAAIKWVEEVLKLKDKFDVMWENCFKQDLLLQTALTKSFADFINMFDRSSEYVSLFIDENLKRGIKGKTEAEIDIVLDKAVILIRYLQDKDMFERYYKKHLARRLLMSKSESADVEKAMITRMKMEIGNAFTQKLEGMFKDMQMSGELTTQYREHIRNLGDMDRKNIDLGVQILTTNHWPVEAVGGSRVEAGREKCTWPSEIVTLQESFKAFYLKERNGRALTWLGYLGNADVKVVFPKVSGKEVGPLSKVRRHELNCSTYAMLVLLQFNDLQDGGSLSFEEIQEATNMPTQELSRQLYTLSVVPKAKVLSKTPDDRTHPKAGDRFSFNTSFSSKAIKIKQPVISGLANKAESEEERRETEEKNDLYRGLIIDSVIVRIMNMNQKVLGKIQGHPLASARWKIKFMLI